MSLDGPVECDFKGCEIRRRTVNHWYVVHRFGKGLVVYKWEDAPPEAMKDGKHFCGLAHMTQHMSNVMTPDSTDPKRESTLELKPPLTREGVQPEQLTEAATETA